MIDFLPFRSNFIVFICLSIIPVSVLVRGSFHLGIIFRIHLNSRLREWGGRDFVVWESIFVLGDILHPYLGKF